MFKLERRSEPTCRHSMRMLQPVLEQARLFGHHEHAANLNLDFGFMYYGLAQMLRQRHVLAIGSGFGSSFACIAPGLRDSRAG